MTSQFRVFVSSTFEPLRTEREFLQLCCDEIGIEAVGYPEQSIAGSGKRQYLLELQRSNVLVLLMGPLSPAVREEITTAGQFGIPILPFVRREREGHRSEWPVDAEMYLRETGADFVAEFDSLSSLRSKFRSALFNVLAERSSSSVRLHEWTSTVYEQAHSLIHAVNSRLAIVQDSSTLVLGPRVSAAERRVYDYVTSMIEEILSGDRDIQFVHLFNIESTVAALAQPDQTYPFRAEALERLRRLADECDGSDSVIVRAVSKPLTAAVVCDNSFEIATTFGTRYYMWLHEFGFAANQLWDTFESLVVDSISLGEFVDHWVD